MAKQKTAKPKDEKTDPDVIKTPDSTSIEGKPPEPVDKVIEEVVDGPVEEVVEEIVAESVEEPEREIKWHFPNASQCPRCKAYDTVATSTKGNKQYRKCRRGHCRHRYCVIGVKEK